MSIPARLLFDLDGTISDPGVGIVRSLNYALVHFGHVPRAETELHVHIGPPPDEIFRALVGLSTPDEIARYIAKYRERYFSVGYQENVLYPGIAEVLADLASSGVPMGVCTSKRTDIAERILEMFGVGRSFRFVDGGDVGIKKSQQIECLKAKGLVDGETIMIGDRAIDIEAAHWNGLCAAGVLWGYGSRQELEAAQPEHLISRPIDLKRLILKDDRANQSIQPTRAYGPRG